MNAAATSFHLSTRDPRQRSPLFRVFIGYADLSAVRQATGTLRETLLQEGRDVILEPILWSFEQLADVHRRSQALETARGAHLIVLASSEAAAFGPKIESWIRDLLAAVHGKQVTLVAIASATEAWTISLEPPSGGTIPESSARTLAA